ncbi:MAG: hypothetical protein DRP01_08890 [Archaeoglobales archaeon]|nr:MAG: hypothetical protein DRP01_08890 [Archaeoglobales archaeon]
MGECFNNRKNWGYDLWDKWSKLRGVEAFGICDKYTKEGSQVMKKQLMRKEQLIGKTIEKIVVSVYPGFLAIHFTDQTVYVAGVEEDFDGVHFLVSSYGIAKEKPRLLYELELITREEYSEICREDLESQKASREKEERKQYEKLKAKYGEGGEEA